MTNSCIHRLLTYAVKLLLVSEILIEGTCDQQSERTALEPLYKKQSLSYAEETDEEITDVAKYGCKFRINRNDADFFSNDIEQMQPHFANFKIKFHSNTRVSSTKGAILPYQWVWTFRETEGFFPYLKWPVDFPLLSFKLLDTRSLHHHQPLNINTTGNCSIELGSRITTQYLGFAFKHFTEDYLAALSREARNSYGYSYWCYMQEVTHAKTYISYTLGLYFAFPVEFSRYNCCKTEVNVRNKSELILKCFYQIPKMYQCTVIPYLIGLVMSAYFPILLFGVSADLKTTCQDGSYQHVACSAGVEEDKWVFLNGKSPINFTYFVCGLCGISKKHPIAVSRMRRAVFVLFAPSIIYAQIFLYWRYMPAITMALLEKGQPLGYRSLIAGVFKSRDTFCPLLGGPFCLLLVFYIASTIFIILPGNIDAILHDAGRRKSNRKTLSPLLYDTETIEQLSAVGVIETYGYGRISAFFKAGIYMLAGYHFWAHSLALQADRFRHCFILCRYYGTRWIAYIVCIVLFPLYVCLCIVELVICIAYYGIPIITVIYIVAKAYASSILEIFEVKAGGKNTCFSNIIHNYFVKYFLRFVFACIFIYYVFSWCSISICTFTFLSEVLIFCLIAVIVYPSTSFGYLFFGVVLLYYVFKLLQGFGSGYFELLADTVEICTLLKEDVFHAQIATGVSDRNNCYRHNELDNSENYLLINPKIQYSKNELLTQKNQVVGVRRDLFEYLVKKYRPVHIQIFHAVVRLCFIIALIGLTISIVLVDPYGPTKGVAEVMHVVFIMAIGALPRILEIAIENSNHIVKKDIQERKMKASIIEFFQNDAFDVDDVLLTA